MASSWEPERSASETVGGADFARAGWFRDPYGRHELRWWDPPRWTDDVRDGATRSTDPVAPPSHGATPRSSPGSGVLDATSLVIAMPAVGSGTWQTTLPVHAAEGDRPFGRVHFGKDRSGSRGTAVWAFLADLDGVPLVGARTTTSRGPGSPQIRLGTAGDGVGPFHAFEILDAHGTVLSRGRHSRVMDRQRVRFSQHGAEVVQLAFTHGRRHQADPTTITAGGTPLGSVVQLGQRATHGPAGSWLRLDRAPGLGEPHRTFVAAAPLVLLTYVT